ncbi:MAG: acyltransferase 3, partial [Actinotalea sp.]|nr:acyltransferase 3 [Actinotalea sp.]
GAVVQVLRHRLPLHWLGAAVSGAAVLGSIWLLDGWGAQLTAPFLAYLMIWLGSVLPCPELVRRHDISYGVYIYAFPVQQLLVLTGIHERGLLLYDVVALACTVPLAVASWLLVERPVMRRVRHARQPATPARADAAPAARAS